MTTPAFFQGRGSPVVERPGDEFWWHSTPLPTGVRTKSKQESQENQFLMWDAICGATPDGFGAKSVLDIGAADGFFAIAAAAAGASRVDAIDLAYIGWPNNLKFLSQQWNIPIHIMTGDFRSYNFERRYDVIFFLGVLYHLEDVFGVFRILHNLLNCRGSVIIETQVSQNDSEFPMFEMASDLFPSTVGQGIEAIDNVGVSNYLVPNKLAIYQLAHMYRFKCHEKIRCSYTDNFPLRHFYVFDKLPDDAARWDPREIAGAQVAGG
jgi:SAM-dependent methyltransferase